MAADARNWAMGKLLKLLQLLFFLLALTICYYVWRLIIIIAVVWPFTWHWECIVSTGLSQVGLSLAVSRFAARCRRLSPNLPTATLQTSKETYLLSHNHGSDQLDAERPPKTNTSRTSRGTYRTFPSWRFALGHFPVCTYYLNRKKYLLTPGASTQGERR